MLKSICKSCSKEFSYNQHHLKGVFCSNNCRKIYTKNLRIQKSKNCLQCNILTINPKFCSRSCSTIYNNTDSTHSEATKLKIGMASATIVRQKFCPVSWCKMCNTYLPNSKRNTCSDKCLASLYTRQGQALAKSISKRSKQEIELFNLCNSYFSNISHNINLVNGWDADIILNDERIAILWNGPWHYRQMPLNNHSLLQVQTRDTIKIQTLREHGWTVLIYEDRYYTVSDAFNDIKWIVEHSGIEPP